MLTYGSRSPIGSKSLAVRCLSRHMLTHVLHLVPSLLSSSPGEAPAGTHDGNHSHDEPDATSRGRRSTLSVLPFGAFRKERQRRHTRDRRTPSQRPDVRRRRPPAGRSGQRDIWDHVAVDSTDGAYGTGSAAGTEHKCERERECGWCRRLEREVVANGTCCDAFTIRCHTVIVSSLIAMIYSSSWDLNLTYITHSLVFSLWNS